MKKASSGLFSGWELKSEVLRPVIVNVLSAGALFLCAVALKNPLYDLFTAPPRVADWPLYCVLEPHPSPSGTDPMVIDLFIVNVGGARYLASDLTDWGRKRSVEDRRDVSTSIEIDLKENARGEKILDVRPDDEFNLGKGIVTATPTGSGGWAAHVGRIEKGVILKLVVMTTVTRPVSTRASCGTLPVLLKYARAPGAMNPCD